MVAESILAFEGDGSEGGGQRFGLHILVLLILVLRFFYSVGTVWLPLFVRRVGRVLGVCVGVFCW